MSDTPIEQWAEVLEAADAERMVQVYRKTASTQDHARRLIEARPHDAHGAMIVAEHQTAGRGRLGRPWHSPRGTALTFSVVHRVDHQTLDRVTFAAAVALAEALDGALSTTPHQTAIKWPNDIYVGGRKIAGILVEVIDGFAIIGMGVNIHLTQDQLPVEIAERATSLAIYGVEADRLGVLQKVETQLTDCLRNRSEQALLDAWHAKCGMFEQAMKLGYGGRVIEGCVVGLDPREGLIVQTKDGQRIHLPAATTTVLDM